MKFQQIKVSQKDIKTMAEKKVQHLEKL